MREGGTFKIQSLLGNNHNCVAGGTHIHMGGTFEIHFSFLTEKKNRFHSKKKRRWGTFDCPPSPLTSKGRPPAPCNPLRRGRGTVDSGRKTVDGTRRRISFAAVSVHGFHGTSGGFQGGAPVAPLGVFPLWNSKKPFLFLRFKKRNGVLKRSTLAVQGCPPQRSCGLSPMQWGAPSTTQLWLSPKTGVAVKD